MNCTYDDKGTGACKQGESRNACGREGGTDEQHTQQEKNIQRSTDSKKVLENTTQGKRQSGGAGIVCLRLTFENKGEKKKKDRMISRNQTEADQRNLRVRRRGAVQEVTLRAWETCTQE